ncbi:MAG: dUTP diphosphatase [Elusimicrobiota bacterium]|nr:dUTP diphosphatase [Elusimicrobiota bacterium]
MIKIKIKKVRDVPLPEYAHPGDSGMDLVNAGKETVIPPGERALIPAGIKIAVPEGWEIQIRSRSGLAVKEGIMVLNSPGTIDAGYRGEIGVILLNTSKESVEINSGMRIAQAVLQKIEKIAWQKVESLEDSSRGDGGFGSTGHGDLRGLH